MSAMCCAAARASTPRSMVCVQVSAGADRGGGSDRPMTHAAISISLIRIRSMRRNRLASTVRSAVPSAKRLMACTVRVWPMRSTRPMRCSRRIGFHGQLEIDDEPAGALKVQALPSRHRWRSSRRPRRSVNARTDCAPLVRGLTAMKRGDAPKAADLVAYRIERVAILGEDDERLAHAPDDSPQHVHLPLAALRAPRRIEEALQHRALVIRPFERGRNRQLRLVRCIVFEAEWQRRLALDSVDLLAVRAARPCAVRAMSPAIARSRTRVWPEPSRRAADRACPIRARSSRAARDSRPAGDASRRRLRVSFTGSRCARRDRGRPASSRVRRKRSIGSRRVEATSPIAHSARYARSSPA